MRLSDEVRWVTATSMEVTFAAEGVYENGMEPEPEKDEKLVPAAGWLSVWAILGDAAKASPSNTIFLPADGIVFESFAFELAARVRRMSGWHWRRPFARKLHRRCSGCQISAPEADAFTPNSFTRK